MAEFVSPTSTHLKLTICSLATFSSFASTLKLLVLLTLILPRRSVRKLSLRIRVMTSKAMVRLLPSLFHLAVCSPPTIDHKLTSPLRTESNPTSFAPPVLIHNKLVLSQTASILLYLSSQLPPLDLDDEDNKEGEPKEKKKKASHPSLTGPATLHTNSFVETLFDLNDQVHFSSASLYTHHR